MARSRRVELGILRPLWFSTIQYGRVIITDFWWLTTREKRKYTYVELAHHEPLKYEDAAPYSAFIDLPLVGVKNIDQWRQRYQNTNIYRSLTVWADESRNDAISGPFIVDIDNESEDLSDALVVTQQIIKYLRDSYNIMDNSVHIFFTGHKGFNLEIHPRALKIQGTMEEQKSQMQCIRKEMIKELQKGKNLVENYVSERDTIIDPLHDHIRLHHSLNKWISKKGEVARVKIELSITELKNLTIEEIIAKSERY